MEDYTVRTSIGGKWFALPAIDVDGSTVVVKGKWLKVGFVHDEDLLRTELGNPERMISELKQQKSHARRADIFTFKQRLVDTTPRFSYPMEWESVAAVRTSSFDRWWEKLPQETRKNVRRAGKRGVVVDVKELDDFLIQGIVDLNNDSPVRQGRRFVHYGKGFDDVKNDQKALLEDCEYVCAYLGEELIGFLKIAYRGEVASLIQILPKASHADKRPANALLAKAVERCQARGASYLTYGLFNYGNGGSNPLLAFKVRNGFEEVLVPRFYVPLTSRGSIAVKLKLYHGFRGMLPASVIGILAGVRAKCYHTASWMSRRSSVGQSATHTR